MVLAQSAKKTPTTEDPFGRTPFSHPALDGLTNLSSDKKNFLTSKLKLAELADKYELQKVLRWSPRNVSRDNIILLKGGLCCYSMLTMMLNYSPKISTSPDSSSSKPIPCTQL